MDKPSRVTAIHSATPNLRKLARALLLLVAEQSPKQTAQPPKERKAS